MKIKYVGVKFDGETAFASESGVTLWLDGDSHEVKDAVAAKMLRHPDVFAEDEEATKESKPVTQPQGEDVAPKEAIFQPATPLAPEVEVGAVAAGLDAMDRAALHALAKEMGVKVHHNAGADTVRAAIEASKK